MTTEHPEPPPRDRAQRRQDTLRRLAEDEDAWVATASADGVPCLVPLSFAWLNESLVMATRETNPTAVHIRETGLATLSLGGTRDVVLISALARTVPADQLPSEEADAFAAKLGWEPRKMDGWCYMRFLPRSLRAWREENELRGRLLMREGEWLP